MLEQEENGLFEIPDYEHVEDETFPPFPPPASPERDPAEAQPDEESGSGAPVPVPPKRTLKRNLPKLDAMRVTSERGLPALRHAKDLKMLIRHMEHWAHRLFPKLQFEDFIDRVENLGNKKKVQTCLKRIQLDLPIIYEDFVSNNDEAEETNTLDATAIGFDPFLTNSSDSNKLASESSRSLTEEQQQRIERNKQLALERRQAKLLSNSQSLENDVGTGEDQEESSGLNTDIADSSHDGPSANTNEEEQFKVEEKQLDHTNVD
ncbi:Tipinl1 [Phodopus roborovskii]|uniref:TIMELESS-interacting protein n=1 Tax=Phodopus roborovskii TaxID=109678 RepID=A0AAU9ZAG6_PHORO|nr:Tipinl1 [Phodopus roborovskii]